MHFLDLTKTCDTYSESIRAKVVSIYWPIIISTSVVHDILLIFCIQYLSSSCLEKEKGKSCGVVIS